MYILKRPTKIFSHFPIVTIFTVIYRSTCFKHNGFFLMKMGMFDFENYGKIDNAPVKA